MASGIRWNGGPALAIAAGGLAALGGSAALAFASGQPGAPPIQTARVVVVEGHGAGNGPERLVRSLGGTVGPRIKIINGFVADVPRGATGRLRAAPGVRSVTPDRTLHAAGLDDEATTDTDTATADDAAGESTDTTTPDADLVAESAIAEPTDDASEIPSEYPEPPLAGDPVASMGEIRSDIGVAGLGEDGEGVDVAVIDSGIVPVDGLDGARVQLGPDFSAEGTGGLDTFGHGTHIAGIVGASDSTGFQGIAPGAGIYSIKAANRDGSTSMIAILRAIDDVVANAHTDGRNIRVMNLSFSADAMSSYRNDPLAAAVEVAWKDGITVVAAAGNGGNESGGVTSPAYDPYVVAVGAVDTEGDRDPSNDTIAEWSNGGDGTRNPDVVAPGAGIVSLRDPGSTLDTSFPAARRGDRYFRGSGTSQASAVVSGAAAVLIAQRPDLTPDQVKALLASTAQPVGSASPVIAGAGTIDVAAAAEAPAPDAQQSWPESTLDTADEPTGDDASLLVGSPTDAEGTPTDDTEAQSAADELALTGEPVDLPDLGYTDTSAEPEPCPTDLTAATTGGDTSGDSTADGSTATEATEPADGTAADDSTADSGDAGVEASADSSNDASADAPADGTADGSTATEADGSTATESDTTADDPAAADGSGDGSTDAAAAPGECDPMVDLTGLRWSGLRWSGLRWSGLRWSGLRWSGLRWTGLRWTSENWGE